MKFMQRQCSGIDYLTYPEWEEEKLSHGFIGKSLDFGGSGIAAGARRLKEAFSLKGLLLLRQVHGRRIIPADEHLSSSFSDDWKEIGEGDGISLGISPGTKRQGICLGIKTADCVPVLMRLPSAFLVLHIGWRGFAAGILDEACGIIKAAGHNRVEVLLGPSASGRQYEVKEEVIRQFGEMAVYREEEAKLFLSLRRSISMRLQAEEEIDFKILKSGICTISSLDFHSHRREGNQAGRNLAFVIV